MPDKIYISEQQLFAEWAEKRNNFSQDGIIDEKSYCNSKPRLLFLMKEVNSDVGFDLRDFIRKGGRTQTWDNMARWIFGIRNLDREVKWKELEKVTVNQRIELFRSICVINLKKSPGKAITDNNELWTIANEDKEFLNRQFNLYYKTEELRPDLIIACGSATSNTFNKIVDLQNEKKWHYTSRGIWYYEYNKGQFFIYYSHPEARVQDCLLYYGLIDAIKELRRDFT